MKFQLFLTFLAILYFASSACSEKREASAISDKLVREMVLSPDGKNVSFEGLAEIIEHIFRLNEAAGLRPGKKYSSPLRSTTGPALDQYLTVGNHEPPDSQMPEFSVVCDLCASVVQVLGLVSQLPQKDIWPTAIKAIKFLCPIVTKYAQDVCDQYVDNYQHTVFYVIPNVAKAPYTVCSRVFKKLQCGSPDQERYRWMVSIPDRLPNPVPPIIPPDAGKDKWRALYLGDLHIDLSYQPGTIAKCIAPLCCRTTSISAESTVHEGDKAGYWGDYRSCDMPLWTFDNMLDHINVTHANEIDLIFVGGDYVAHDSWIVDPERNKKLIQMVADKLSEKVPGKPIYMILGNHEMTPLNDFAFDGDPPEFSSQWLYDKLADVTRKWLDQTTLATIKRAGFYTTLLKPGWRLIVLNDNMYQISNFLIYGRPDVPDPYSELKWLVDTLLEAENKGERVTLFTHMHGGDDDLFQAWSWNYYRIINRFAHIITAQLHGHTHKDSPVLFYDAETLTKPISVAYVGPALTAYSHNNIGYRLYDFDTQNYNMLDYHQFYVDIETANENETSLDWMHEYSARSEYSLPDMSAESWADFAKRVQTNMTLFDLYNKHYLLSLSEPQEPCGVDCRRNLICNNLYGSLSHPGDGWCENFYPNPKPINDDEDPSKRICSPRFLKRIDAK